LPGDKDYLTYARGDGSTEAIIWQQVEESLGTFAECASALIRDHPNLTPLQVYSQHMEWIQNTLRMHRQCRYGFFKQMRKYVDNIPDEVVDLHITIDGHRLDQQGRLMPPIQGTCCPALPTPQTMLDCPSSLWHIPMGVFRNALKMERRLRLEGSVSAR